MQKAAVVTANGRFRSGPLDRGTLRDVVAAYNEPLVYSVLSLLYRGIKFESLSVKKKHENGEFTYLGDTLSDIFMFHWAPLARKISDWLLMFGFVAVGKKTIDVPVKGDLKMQFPGMNMKKGKTTVPFIPDIEHVYFDGKWINGELDLHAYLMGDMGAPSVELLVLYGTRVPEYDHEMLFYCTEYLTILKEYRNYKRFHDYLSYGLKSLLIPPVFVEPAPPPERGFHDAPQYNAMNSQIFFELQKQGKEKKQSRVFERDEEVQDGEKYDDISDNARLLKPGFRIAQIQPSSTLPFDLNFHGGRLTNVASNTLGVPIQQATGGGKFASSSKQDEYRITFSRQKVIMQVLHVYKKIWGHFFNDGNIMHDILFDMSLHPPYDIEDLLVLQEHGVIEDPASFAKHLNLVIGMTMENDNDIDQGAVRGNTGLATKKTSKKQKKQEGDSEEEDSEEEEEKRKKKKGNEKTTSRELRDKKRKKKRDARDHSFGT